MLSIFMKLFAHVPLIAKCKIPHLELEKEQGYIIFALCTRKWEFWNVSYEM